MILHANYVKIYGVTVLEVAMHGKILGTELPCVLALAYLGDARHALYVRRMLVGRGISKSGELNEASLNYVTAESQARMFGRLLSIRLA